MVQSLHTHTHTSQKHATNVNKKKNAKHVDFIYKNKKNNIHIYTNVHLMTNCHTVTLCQREYNTEINMCRV